LKSPAVYNFIYLSVENNIFGNRYVFKFYVNEKNFEKFSASMPNWPSYEGRPEHKYEKYWF